MSNILVDCFLIVQPVPCHRPTDCDACFVCDMMVLNQQDCQEECRVKKKPVRLCQQGIIVLLFALCVCPVFSACKESITPDMPLQSRWVFSRASACLHSDHVHRLAANHECLALQTYWGGQLPKKNSTLLVFIHGDGIPGGGPSDYFRYQATQFAKPGVISVVLIRPGYYDSYGHYSTGESHAYDCRGFPCDNYRPHTINTLAKAITKLKTYYHARCTILVGHSGGAIMSNIILGKYPHLVNGAVLASTTYDVNELAKAHGLANYTHSLSPSTFINRIPKNDFVYIVSGTNDQATYPPLSLKLYRALKKHGITSRYYVVQGGTHDSVVLGHSQQLHRAIEQAIRGC